MNVLLIGPRASGKSTIGPALARLLGRPFVELDDLALRATGLASVHDVWRQRGEMAWRDAEAACFHTAIHTDGQVIALGGGAPMIAAIQNAVQAARRHRRAVVAYLSCEVGELQRRLSSQSGDRPSLTGIDPVDEVEVVLEDRKATYDALADFVCHTAHATPEESAMKIANLLKQWEAQPDQLRTK